METEIRAVIEASALRRWVGVVTLAAIAGLLIYGVLALPGDPLVQAVMAGLGVAALWLAERLRRATGHRIELTGTELRDSSGVCIVKIDNIVALNRGSFAFKPTNGFLLRTKTPGSRAWRPGMWWRIGTRIGIGGVTPSHQAKAMAALLDQDIAARGQASDHLI
ncbi:hypothetical protein ACFMPD_02020 [Sedimentitalea sp. HM32M-2]|uniref:hypothetical protein n=1 Tax=Sedimentitalea sp. HM32M-2 TaxID=3351566 RepID=UPI003629609D